MTYKSNDISINVCFDDESVWLTQTQMVKLFARTQPVISRHISNVFKEKELVKESNMQNLHNANSDKPVTFTS